MPRLHLLAPLALALSCATLVNPAEAAVGDARVAKWKDDRVAAFMLMFDDGWPGQVEVAIPALQQRGLVATFYMVPQKGEYKALAAKWAEAIKGGGVVYGDHTMSHRGITDIENARWEIGECARIIREELQPGGKPGRLVSFAKPGGVSNWNVTPDELSALFKVYKLVERPPFAQHGAVYHWKTLGEMTALGDKAIASRGMDYLILHGVERIGATYQDFWPLKQDIFLPLLDYLKDKQDKRELWVTDHISLHQYETERDSATVKTLRAQSDVIHLQLASSADPELYDQPLTLVVEVPPRWRECEIAQGSSRTRATAANGTLTFDALPDGATIGIRPATGK